MKKAILVVSFGTSYKEAREKAIASIEQAIDQAFPEYEVRRAFTSSMIKKKLKKEYNITVNNVQEALSELYKEGFEEVICQPTHIINGIEYEKIVQEVNCFKDKFKTIQLGTPLIHSHEDYVNMVQFIKREFQVLSDTALVFMGHGSEHPANSVYAALNYYFSLEENNNCFIGTVEGFPEVETILSQVQKAGYKKVLLAPLMIVAGDHAINDMAGDEEDSWLCVFKNNGFETEVCLKGLGEYESIRQMFIAHIHQVL